MIVQTGAILTLIFLIGIIVYHRNMNSGKLYFAMLLCMSLPSLFNREFLKEYISIPQDQTLTILLGFLLLMGYLPWHYFNQYIAQKKDCTIEISQKHLRTVKFFLFVLICLSIFSIVYQIPLAIANMALGAANIRSAQVGDIIPNPGIMTTLAVGFAAFNIYCILFFFISIITPQLKKFRLWLLVCSFSNIIGSLVFAGRDQLIVFISLFLIFYMVFRPYIPYRIQKTISRTIIVSCSLIIVLLYIISSDRFSANNSLENGTIGYIAEQPYVFNAQVLDHYKMGPDRRFPILNALYDTKTKWDPSQMRNAYEWQFSTQYGEFYAIGGNMWSLILFSLIFIGYYSLSMRSFVKNNKMTSAILLFTVYLYLCITGLFYIKASGSVLTNIFYIVLSIIPFLINEWIITKRPQTKPIQIS